MVRILSILTCVLLWSATQLQAQEELVEQSAYTFKEILNVPYYDDPALSSDLTQLNLILPEGVEQPPVLMWLGGGAWAYVNRHQEMDLCRKMARQGIAVISVGHRLSPQLLGKQKNPEGIQHPEHIRDVAQAFRWIHDHAAEFGYNPDQIYVGGFSCGAHLAALLASDKRYLESLGLSTADIKAIIPVAGGYDIPHYRDELIKENPAYLENHIHAVFGESQEQQQDEGFRNRAHVQQYSPKQARPPGRNPR